MHVCVYSAKDRALVGTHRRVAMYLVVDCGVRAAFLEVSVCEETADAQEHQAASQTEHQPKD